MASSRARKLTAIRMDPTVLDTVDAHADAIGSNRSAVIRAAIAEYMARHVQPRPSSTSRADAA